MTTSKVHLKLLIHTKSKRVLFAEPGKDFVDFIFHILSLPFASVISLLGKQEMVGCLGNLYDSVENLNNSYLLQGNNKDMLLKPKISNPITSVPLSLISDKPTDQKIVYTCIGCAKNPQCSVYDYSTSSYRGSQYSFSHEPNTPCFSCSKPMARILTYVAPPTKKDESREGGLVKDAMTYMIMDDFVVKPLSTISSVALLHQFNVKEISALQVKEVDIGMKEALKLLKESLHSNNALTNVFYEDVCESETKSATRSRNKGRKL